MAIKTVKSFAEYAVRKWMADNWMTEKDFTVRMDGREAALTDSNGDSVILVYDGQQRRVYPKEVRE